MVRVQEGDREAFRLLYEKYRRPIMSFLYSMIKNKNVAEELFQETFMKLYRSRESYEPRAKFSTFLWTIAKHTALDWLEKKRESLESGTSPNGEGESTLTLEESLESEIPNAEAALIERMDAAAINDCISRLSESDRMLTSLRIHSELSYEEIANQAQMPLGTVKTRLHRARTQLEKCLRLKMGVK